MSFKNTYRLLFTILFMISFIGIASAAINVTNITNTSISYPIANFSANDTTICKYESVQFKDMSTGNPVSWYWFILPYYGLISHDQNPIYKFNNTGSYTINLTVINSVGLTNTTSKPNYIIVTNCTTPTPTPTPTPTQKWKKPKFR